MADLLPIEMTAHVACQEIVVGAGEMAEQVVSCAGPVKSAKPKTSCSVIRLQ